MDRFIVEGLFGTKENEKEFAEGILSILIAPQYSGTISKSNLLKELRGGYYTKGEKWSLPTYWANRLSEISQALGFTVTYNKNGQATISL